MKTLVTLLMIFGLAQSLNAQNTGERVVNNAKNKTTGRAEARADETVDKALNKVEEGIGSIFKKKDKSTTTKSGEGNATENDAENTEGGTTDGSSNSGVSKTGFQSYSKFDFVPGERVVAFEDFSQDAVGDFPAQWNTNSSGEVVTISGLDGNWANFKDEGVFVPEFIQNLPENCTIEFEIGVFRESAVLTRLLFLDAKVDPNLMNLTLSNGTEVVLEPVLGDTEVRTYNASNDVSLQNKKRQLDFYAPEGEDYSFAKVSIWKQKSRLRVYLNENKIWDIPKAFSEGGDYRFLLGTSTFFIEGREFFLSNLRFAEGMADTRSKLITEGKFTTQGIVFDTGSATIKPESAGVLKEIATVLKENPNVKVHILGHTDSDGNDATNQSLSEKRAEAVKQALSQEFGVDSSRMSTEGKGESEPVASNSTPAGKAQNRRVEFIKK